MNTPSLKTISSFSEIPKCVVFDLETTGIDVKTARIIEIGIEVYKFGKLQYAACKKVNPKMQVSPEILAMTYNTQEELDAAPTFKNYAKGLFESVFMDSVVAGFNNLRFDVQILIAEFARAGFDYDIKPNQVIDCHLIKQTQERQTLSWVYNFYTGKTMENAHTADADVAATTEILFAQLEKYKGKDLETMMGGPYLDYDGKLRLDDKGDLVLNFGQKHYKKTVRKILEEGDQSFIWDYMLNPNKNGTFSKEVIEGIRAEVIRIEDESVPILAPNMDDVPF